MKKKVLVTYGTRCGSTGEVAKAIGETLCAADFEVNVMPAQEVKSLDGYDRVVIGTAVRMGGIMPEIKRFVGRQKAKLSAIPVAHFVVCLTMKDDTPENRAKSLAFLAPIAKGTSPVSTGLFAGAMDLAKLNGFFRWMASKDKSGAFKTEDCRNWSAIKAWGEELAVKFA